MCFLKHVFSQSLKNISFFFQKIEFETDTLKDFSLLCSSWAENAALSSQRRESLTITTSSQRRESLTIATSSQRRESLTIATSSQRRE